MAMTKRRLRRIFAAPRAAREPDSVA